MALGLPRHPGASACACWDPRHRGRARLQARERAAARCSDARGGLVSLGDGCAAGSAVQEGGRAVRVKCVLGAARGHCGGARRAHVPRCRCCPRFARSP